MRYLLILSILLCSMPMQFFTAEAQDNYNYRAKTGKMVKVYYDEWIAPHYETEVFWTKQWNQEYEVWENIRNENTYFVPGHYETRWYWEWRQG